MKKIVIPGRELYDPRTNQFITEDSTVIEIEPSLYALKKWESKWHIYFIGNDNLNEEQKMDYIRCITLTPDVPDSVWNRLTRDNIKEINEYINNPMTATTFRKTLENEERSSELITNETIYWMMVELGIPQEYQYWHINQLLTLIKFISTKRKEQENKAKRKGKKAPFTTADYNRRKALNEARKKQFNTHG